MRLVHTVAHARHAAPAFAVLKDHELLTLRQLPAWVRWLYLELVAMSDFKSGRVRTSYAQLAALLGYDAPEHGPRVPVPTLKQIRTALDHLAGVGLTGRDKRTNEQTGALEILVLTREGFGTSTKEQGRVQGRGVSPRKADEHRAKPKQAPTSGQGSGQVYQEINSLLPLPLHVDKLSTGDGRKRAAELSDRLARERGKKRAPQGASHPPLRGTPPVVPAMTALGDVLPGVDHQGPPGGQASAPAGHAPPIRSPGHQVGDATAHGLDDAGPGISGKDPARERAPSKPTTRGGPKSGDG